MKRLNVLAAIALCSGSLLVPGSVDAQDARLGFRSVSGSLVVVNAWVNEKTREAFGTGFVVQSSATETYVLTARHVIKGASFITIDLLASKSSKKATIVIVGSGNREDLALLRIPVGHLPAVTFDEEVPEVGEPLAVAGFPKTSMDLVANGMGLDPLLLGPGTVSSLPDERKLMTLANVSVQEGLSGAPVFDLSNGQIVGIVDTQLPGEAVNGIAIGTRVIMPFLNKKLSAVRVDRHDQLALSASTNAPPPQPRPQPPVAPPPAPPPPPPVAPPPAAPTVAPTVAPTARAVALATPNGPDPTVAVRQAEGYIASRHYDLAVGAVNTALAADPKFPRAWLDMGLIQFRTSHTAAAIVAFTRAITYDSGYDLAYNNRGYAYALQGHFPQAIADFTQAITLDPKNSHAYTNRGTVYLDEGQADAAIADFDQAIALDANNPITYNNRGNAHFTKGQLDAATADYNKALAIDPKYARAYLGLGTIALQQQQYEAAIASYTKSIDIDPKNAKAYSNRGAAYALSGQYAQAIADSNQALALDPKNAYAYYYRGLSNFKTGQAAAATTDYQQASSLAPQQKWAAYH